VFVIVAVVRHVLYQPDQKYCLYETVSTDGVDGGFASRKATRTLICAIRRTLHGAAHNFESRLIFPQIIIRRILAIGLCQTVCGICSAHVATGELPATCLQPYRQFNKLTGGFTKRRLISALHWYERATGAKRGLCASSQV
jgi:hypothetical protein